MAYCNPVTICPSLAFAGPGPCLERVQLGVLRGVQPGRFANPEPSTRRLSRVPFPALRLLCPRRPRWNCASGPTAGPPRMAASRARPTVRPWASMPGETCGSPRPRCSDPFHGRPGDAAGAGWQPQAGRHPRGPRRIHWKLVRQRGRSGARRQARDRPVPVVPGAQPSGSVACIAGRPAKPSYHAASASRPLRQSRAPWRKSRYPSAQPTAIWPMSSGPER